MVVLFGCNPSPALPTSSSNSPEPPTTDLPPPDALLPSPPDARTERAMNFRASSISTFKGGFLEANLSFSNSVLMACTAGSSLPPIASNARSSYLVLCKIPGPWWSHSSLAGHRGYFDFLTLMVPRSPDRWFLLMRLRPPFRRGAWPSNDLDPPGNVH